MDVRNNLTVIANDTLWSVPFKFRSIFDVKTDRIIGTAMLIVEDSIANQGDKVVIHETHCYCCVEWNALAIRVFIKRRKREITVSETFLLHIAVVDLILALVSFPAFIVSCFAHQWMFGEIGCSIYGGTCYFLGLATILSLTALAVFRFVKTCFSQLGIDFDPKKANRTIGGIYLYSAAWSLMPVFGLGAYDIEPFGLSCTLDWTNPTPSGSWYIIAVSFFCVFLPAVVIIGSHLAIFLQIRRLGRMRQSRTPGKQVSKVEMQLFYVSLGVCFGFLFAWLPYAGFSLYAAFGNPTIIPVWLSPLPVIMAKSSIAYNPIIYVILTKSYRLDFMAVISDVLHMTGNRNSTAPCMQIQMIPLNEQEGFLMNSCKDVREKSRTENTFLDKL